MRILPVPAALLAALLAAPPSVPAAGDPVPEGAALTVAAGKEEYLLGERVELVLTLRNDGPRPFTVDPMVWQRFAVRDEFLSVSLVDGEGAEAWDPFPERTGGGGPSPPPVTLGKGETWEERFELWRYRVPDHPGDWTLRVSRSFGWEETPGRPNPLATMVLRLREPSGKEAEGVVDAELARGREARLHGAARPIYIPILEARAAAGSEAAVAGLALNRDPAATAALLRLFASKDRAVADRAAAQVAERIRIPWKEGDPWGRTMDAGGTYIRRSRGGFQFRLGDPGPSWRPEFVAPARTAARAFLAGDGLPVAGWAGDVLCLLGTPEDGPPVAAALDRLARQFENPEKDWNAEGYWKRERDMEDDVDRLLAAASVVTALGGPVPADPRSAGEAILWLAALDSRKEEDTRPAEWWKTLAMLGNHPMALVRCEVAGSCRWGGTSMPENRRLVLQRLREDPDERVRKAAGK